MRVLRVTNNQKKKASEIVIKDIFLKIIIRVCMKKKIK